MELIEDKGVAETVYIFKNRLGVVAYACNPKALGGQGGQMS